MLSTLGKILSRRHLKIFFLIFPRKQDLKFHANLLKWRQFAWKCQILFSGENKKNITNLPSAEPPINNKEVPSNFSIQLFIFYFTTQSGSETIYESSHQAYSNEILDDTIFEEN